MHTNLQQIKSKCKCWTGIDGQCPVLAYPYSPRPPLPDIKTFFRDYSSVGQLEAKSIDHFRMELIQCNRIDLFYTKISLVMDMLKWERNLR